MAFNLNKKNVEYIEKTCYKVCDTSSEVDIIFLRTRIPKQQAIESSIF